MENAFDNLARAVAEVTTNLTVILPAAHLARDYHLPVRVWASPDTRMAELQRRLHNVWERAVIDGLDHNARFNHAWRQALTLAQQVASQTLQSGLALPHVCNQHRKSR